MRILVTGACGQLGYDVVLELHSREIESVATDVIPGASGLPEDAPFLQLDITDRDAVLEALEQFRPDAVIHCAGWTAVDAAEEPQNLTRVFTVNEKGTRILAEASKAVGCKMLYISTDYVFNGKGTKPWKPDSKAFAPLNVYGQSKLAGEQAVQSLLERYFIVRIAWAFGMNGINFVKTMLRIGNSHDEVRVVNDQIGTPTYTPDLARLLVDMIQTERYGIYHVTNEGPYISWYEFACEIYRQAGMHTRVIPVTTDEYGLSKASRPHNSRLDRTKLVESGFRPLPDWKNALKRYLQALDLARLANHSTDDTRFP